MSGLTTQKSTSSDCNEQKINPDGSSDVTVVNPIQIEGPIEIEGPIDVNIEEPLEVKVIESVPIEVTKIVDPVIVDEITLPVTIAAIIAPVTIDEIEQPVTVDSITTPVTIEEINQPVIVEQINQPLTLVQPVNVRPSGTVDGNPASTAFFLVNNLRQQILATHNRQQAITYADFGLITQRVTRIDYTSASFPGFTARKDISYSLVLGRYRRDSINWSIV